MRNFQRPKFTDIPAHRTQYKAGDRILVKTGGKLSIESVRKITKMVQKHCCADVNVLVVNVCVVQVLRIRNRETVSLADVRDLPAESKNPAVANIRMVAVDLQPGDRVVAVAQQYYDVEFRRLLQDRLRVWAGDDVESIVLQPTGF